MFCPPKFACCVACISGCSNCTPKVETMLGRTAGCALLFCGCLRAPFSLVRGAVTRVEESSHQRLEEPELRPLYLDVQATTPLDPRVLDRMLPYLVNYYGNPHSRTHAYGWESEKAMEKARELHGPQGDVTHSLKTSGF